MAELRIPEPSEKQCLFMADKHKYIGYGGARGGGKSWAVRVKAVLLCLRYAGIKVMIIRKTYPELQENHIIPLCEMLGCYADGSERIASYNDGKKHIVFPNGSRILFRYCDNDKDALRFQGTEVDVLFVDEATQQSEEKMEKLRACVRGVNDFPKRVYYTCNPGGEGHAWVKRLFIDRRFKEGEEPEEHSFIQSLITDNTALMEADPQYIKQLEALPPKLRDAWLYGNWEIFEGQFFEDFRTEPDMRAAAEHGESLTADELRAQRRWVHVIEPFDLSTGSCRGWRIIRRMSMEFMGVAGVAAIGVIAYLIGEAVKISPADNKYIPVICGTAGALLGVAAMYTVPEFPAGDIINAIAVGIVSGLSATGADQIAKQMKK